MPDLDVWKAAAISLAAVGQTAFVLLYLTFPWWQTFLGRALFAKALTLALLIDIAVIGLIWDWPAEQATIIGLYGLVAVGIWGQVLAFLRITLTHRVSRNGGVRGEGIDQPDGP